MPRVAARLMFALADTVETAERERIRVPRATRRAMDAVALWALQQRVSRRPR